MFRLLAKGVLFVAGLGVLLVAAGAIVESRVPWRRYQDPRSRLTWDGEYDGSRLVLLGDSEFCSYYVDSPDQTIWARLEDLAREQVFPGALNGAKPADLVAAATHVAEEWPEGTLFFVNIAPTRFVVTRAEEPPVGNYPDMFLKRYGIDPEADDPLEAVEGAFYRTVVSPLFLVRNREVLGNAIDRPRYFRQWAHFNRAWSDDPDFARERFRLFAENLVVGAEPKPFGWLTAIERVLEAGGGRAVFVLTPLNGALVRQYADAEAADTIEHHLLGIAAAVKAHLHAQGADTIDLTGAVASECFADLVHTNVCGDDRIANGMADWIATNAPAR